VSDEKPKTSTEW